jgi:hypothetical protein
LDGHLGPIPLPVPSGVALRISYDHSAVIGYDDKSAANTYLGAIFSNNHFSMNARRCSFCSAMTVL